MSTVLLQLAAEDPGARERLRRFWQRARVMAGVGLPPSPDASLPPRATGMRFPGDGFMFALVTGFLILCCHVSWVHLVQPGLARQEWPSELFAALAAVAAVATFKLAQLRRGPRAVEEALPDPAVGSPLVELHDFVASMRRELEASARLQRQLAIALFGALAGVALWGLVLHSFGHLRFAELLISAAALTASFMATNWRPFRSAARRHQLALKAEGIAAALAEKIRDLRDVPEDAARSAREWTVVRDALTGVLPPRPRPSASSRRPARFVGRSRFRRGRGGRE